MKQYIRVNDKNEVIHGFSSIFEKPKKGDIEYGKPYQGHFSLFDEANPPLFEEDVPLYKYVNHELVKRTAEEIEASRYPDGRPVEDETPVFTNSELVTMFEEVGETIATLHEENQMLMEAVAELETEVSNLREEGA